jgi:hypothetical protein
MIDAISNGVQPVFRFVRPSLIHSKNDGSPKHRAAVEAAALMAFDVDGAALLPRPGGGGPGTPMQARVMHASPPSTPAQANPDPAAHWTPTTAGAAKNPFSRVTPVLKAARRRRSVADATPATKRKAGALSSLARPVQALRP